MAYRYLVLLLALVASPAFAWSTGDTVLESGYLTLHVIDWGQSLQISHFCNSSDPEQRNYYESNPILGSCPSRGAVNRYFLIGGIAHYAISRALPQPYRRLWQFVSIGMEAHSVSGNFDLGLKIRF